MEKYIPLNFALILHPINWIIILLMITIAGLGLSLIFPDQPAKAEV